MSEEDILYDFKRLHEDNARLLRELLSCQKEIKRLKQENNQKWIKVSKRFPEHGERVLFTNGSFVGEGFYNLHAGMWHHLDYRWIGIDSLKNDYTANVIAWMPMPKYEEDGE